ncbi:MAG: phage capsid protein [Undibacterium sp.]|uniref:phage capsid protein n=1 Tax=Undibacterium sp. TaxID=1914977 RepID=UPI00272688AC|nr:phage capsid protein [Undibacterium sp.]MDO8654196.1 phage capsid protein [Undibacterium sp.]
MSTTGFPINPELSAIAIAYRNSSDSLIADAVLPRVPTPFRFKYTKYDAAQGYTVPQTKVGRKSEPNMVDFGGTDVTDECADYGLDDLLPNAEVEAFDAMPKPSTGGPISPKAISTMMLSNLILLDREVRVASAVFNAANYIGSQQQTLSGTSQWSDYVNSNPLSALLSALDTPLMRPNKLVIGRQAWTSLRQHPKVVQAVYKSAQSAGTISREQLAELLELEEICIGGAFVNTARKGQTAAYARTWGKHAALIYSNTQAAMSGQPTFGFTAQFGTRIAGEIPAPTKGLRGGVIIRTGESVKEVICAPDVGYYFQNCVA